MKKIIKAVGDIHGESFWKGKNINLFIGDYVDSFHIPVKDQLKNLKDIIQYKKDNPDVILLLGNHDVHYLSFWKEQYPGFQRINLFRYRDLFEENLDLFQIAHETDTHIFSHAGLTKTWMENNNCESIEDVNELWKYKPKSFIFRGPNAYGNHKSNGPLWIRSKALLDDFWGNKIQVVGHTLQDKITVIEDKLILIDNHQKQILEI